ncbi:MAG: cysteine desulfurase [bacterium]
MNDIIQTAPASLTTLFDVHSVRKDFPILRRTVHHKPLVYLDNAATSQKPLEVIQSIQQYYLEENSNVHRGVHHLSEIATEHYELVRSKVQRFIGSESLKEIIFVRGATEAINLVAQTYGRVNVQAGDEVLISAMEHHSNIVPWQLLCEEKDARLRIIPMIDSGELELEAYQKLLTKRTKIVALTHVSNALGTINPVREMIALAHTHGIPVLLDGAQAVAHLRVDMKELDCDFYVFSSHKMFGPTGIGILYGKQHLLEAMPPYQGGGDMIRSVTFEKTIFNDLPYKYEAGTPNIAGTIGFGTAIDYLNRLDWTSLSQHEHSLMEYATRRLSEIKNLKVIGTAKEKVGVISFILDEIHPHDIGTILDQEGVAIRTGHHCAQPVMDRFGIPATARASFAFYNTTEDIDALIDGLHKVQEVFR